MHTFILIWSHRPDSQSTKVGRYLESVIQQTQPDDTVFVYDLRNNPIPLRNDRVGEKESAEYQEFYTSTWQQIEEELHKADALVFVCPEWNGMVTPGVKNFMIYLTPQLVGNKPTLLVAVSSTNHGGHYPIAEMRMSSFKNKQMCYIPQHVIVSSVKKILNDHQLEWTEKADIYMKKRLQYSLRMLREYGDALKLVRESGVADFENYKDGM